MTIELTCCIGGKSGGCRWWVRKMGWGREVAGKGGEVGFKGFSEEVFWGFLREFNMI